MINKGSIKSLKRELEKAKKLCLISHHNPDGDAIGSILSVYHLLKEDYQIEMIVPSGFPDFLSWIPGSELIINAQKDKEKAENALKSADIIFCMDFNGVKRVEALSEHLSGSKAIKVLIDHHPQPTIDDFDILFSYTEPSSTAELMYHIAIDAGWESKMN